MFYGNQTVFITFQHHLESSDIIPQGTQMRLNLPNSTMMNGVEWTNPFGWGLKRKWPRLYRS